MFPFFKKSKSYLGIDIAAGGIKVVELKNEKGRARLTTYGFTDTPSGDGLGTVDKGAEAAALLGKILKKAKTTTTKAVTGLHISSVFSALVSVPAREGKELRAAIELQARKLVPLPLEQMVIDWKMLPVQEGANTSVLITGAAKTLVGKYIDIFKRAKLDLLSLETEAFALVRSLVGKEKGGVLVCDMGAVRTSLIVISGGIPMISRSLDIGGAAITKTLASHMGVSLSQAEDMKRDLRSVGNELPKTIENMMTILANEIKYNLNLYTSQGEGAPVEKILLTGGSAQIPGIPEFMTRAVGIKTFLGDPWARVIYPESLRPVLDAIGSRFAVAIGLAMRDIE